MPINEQSPQSHPSQHLEEGDHTPHGPLNGDIPRNVALSWRAITKKYGDKRAVDSLDLDIPTGSFYGIVGPNGAGKTTAITIATGLLRPDEGQVLVNGYDVWSDDQVKAKASFGLLADGLPIFDRLSGWEYLDYVGRLRSIAPSVVASRADSLLGALGLEEARDKMIVDYSAGMTKKILLAAALLHRPQLLILDEPLEAVDPVSATIIRSILRRYVASGGTVVLSSHVMEVVENLCDHVALIADGKVRAAGTIEEVRGGKTLSEAFVDLVGGGAYDDTSLAWLGQSGSGESDSSQPAPEAGR